MRFSPSSFTGKERDEETGYGYFGARYMDHELMTMWISVDPLADKYPSISPYAYCAWNPVRLVDPDGRKIWIYNYDGKGSNLRYEPGKTRPMGTKAAQEQIRSLNRMTQTDAGWKLIYRMDKSGDNFYISNKSTGTPQTSVTTACSDGAMLKMNGNNDIRSIAHELFHAFQINQDQGGTTYYNEVEAYVFGEIVTKQYYNNIGSEPPKKSRAFLSQNPNTNEGKAYENAMNTLLKRFDSNSFNRAVDLFQSHSEANATGIYDVTSYEKCSGKEKPLLPSFYPSKKK
jgi:RHS repeat-associated protein